MIFLCYISTTLLRSLFWILKSARLANSFHDEDDPNSLEDDTNNTERYVHFLSNSYSVVDEALQAFLKIRAALTNDPGIQEVASNPKLQNKIPGYSVRMGYGTFSEFFDFFDVVHSLNVFLMSHSISNKPKTVYTKVHFFFSVITSNYILLKCVFFILFWFFLKQVYI